MICYLPFTYIAKRYLSVICSQLGPLTVYTPSEALAPDHMRAAAVGGDIDLRPLQSLAPGQLIPAIQEFKQWADLHQGSLADMAGFYKAAKGRFPMMDETNPSQISTQIRNLEGSTADEDENPLFQAALFLAMAQDYDQQQEIMRQRLGAVYNMEREMMARLSGGLDGGTGTELGAAPTPLSADLETGGYMTVARVQAWTQLALQEADPPLVYLTSSPAVIDHLLNLFPEAERAAHLKLSTDGICHSPSAQQRRDALRRLADAATPRPDVLTGFELADEDGAAGLMLYALTGISPRAMLQRLYPSISADDTVVAHPNRENHALIGLVALP